MTMIITQRTANLSYSTDPVAASLRSAIAAPAPRFAPRAESTPASTTPMDLGALYPTLFAPERQPKVWGRPARAAAFRLSLMGTIAAILAVIYR
jgi:hypothetical protein